MYNAVTDPCAGILHLMVKFPVLGVTILGCGAAVAFFTAAEPDRVCGGMTHQTPSGEVCIETTPAYQPYTVEFID